MRSKRNPVKHDFTPFFTQTPLSTMTPLSSVDRRELRNALGAFPTGVTIVTTRASNGSFVGLTVNSFNSLSLDPPLILWSINDGSASLAAFEQSSHFAVNILCEEQAEVSRRFASAVSNKFGGLDILDGAGGVPVIAGCAAHLECRTYSHQRAGDHVLFIGQVERFTHCAKRPLIYYRGNYFAAGEWEGPESVPVMNIRKLG